MIVEMAGRPAEHLTESLEKHIGILNEVNDIKVHSIKVSEPREIEVGEAVSVGEVMFTAFAEADFETENFSRLTETVFDFMPSSVEVIEPSSVNMGMTDATALLNNISGRMHRYDEIMKIAGERLNQMNAQLKAAQEALIEKDAEIAKAGSKKGIKKKADKKVGVNVKGNKKVGKKRNK